MTFFCVAHHALDNIIYCWMLVSVHYLYVHLQLLIHIINHNIWFGKYNRIITDIPIAVWNMIFVAYNPIHLTLLASISRNVLLVSRFLIVFLLSLPPTPPLPSINLSISTACSFLSLFGHLCSSRFYNLISALFYSYPLALLFFGIFATFCSY